MHKNQDPIVSVAPMMDWTDRHCRWFHRQLSVRAWLYTEMIVADAILHGDRAHLLESSSVTPPLALQIGGCTPLVLAQAARIGEDFGYKEINLNVGCPSDRVQSGQFGACLMQSPDLVAECFAEMQARVDVAVTVKCRLGVDEQDITQTLPHFMETVSAAGCQYFIIHARKAWLAGLSPKQNREIPLLDYEIVHQMKRRFPHLTIILNGGLTNLDMADRAAQGLDGVMFGRAAYNQPWLLSEIDTKWFGCKKAELTRADMVTRVGDYVRAREDSDATVKALVRHIMGLYAGVTGARRWRRALSQGLVAGWAPSQIIQAAGEKMEFH